MVVVMVSPTVAPPRDTECADVPGGPQAETWLAQDVPQEVAARYRVLAPGAWGLLGVSTGGFCAVKLVLRHPDVFCCAVGMSGYLHAITDLTTGDLYQHDAALRHASDPLWRLAHLPQPRVRILLTASRAESDLNQQAQAFVAADRSPLQVATLMVPSGGHNFGVWVGELPTCLQWLSLSLPGAPDGGAPLPPLPVG
jgi:S-formylglutathione hydrolase FrmB